MANEVTISVKVKNDTHVGLTSVDTSLKRIGDSANSAGSVASSALSSLGSMASSVSGNVYMLAAVGAAAGAALVAAFSSVVPVLSLVGGAAGGAATSLVGLASVVGVLTIGFGGIGNALGAYTKQQAKSGGAATDNAAAQKAAADRIYSASRQLRDAKDAEADAAKNVNQARAEEIDRLRELDLSLRGANISQAEAAQALIEAKEKARRANEAGSAWEKAEANNAVTRAQLTYDQQTEKLGDLTAEKKKAVKDGVEGSDKVQRALDAESKAHQRVLDAQHDLASAQEKTATASTGAAGGIDLFAQAMAKLSPNARDLVYALIDINKQFDEVKKRVQERLFEGWADAVRELADKWMPHLDSILGKTADHLNLMGLAAAKALGDPTFIENIEKASDATGTFLDHLTAAGTAGTDAFGRIAAAATPFTDKVGELIERIVVAFDKWIKKVDESGALNDFFEEAAHQLQNVYDVGALVMTIIGQVIELIWPTAKKASDSVFDSVKNTLTNISDWLADPANKQEVDDFVQSIVDLGTAVRDLWPVFKFVMERAVARFEEISFVVRNVVYGLQWMGRSAVAVWNWILATGRSVINWFASAGRWLSSSLSGAWDGLVSGFRSAINWIIDRWNSLSFTMPSFLGGGTYGVGQIAHRATGGVAGGLTMINERGGELVKLPSGSMVYPHGQSQQMMRDSASNSQTVVLAPAASGDALLDAIWTAIAGRVRIRGGVVQTALGVAGAH